MILATRAGFEFDPLFEEQHRTVALVLIFHTSTFDIYI